MELTPRKRRILQVIVQDYIKTAEPIGSRTIIKKYDLGVSSATVRNEMADLEEMGFLIQPHTSAGRVPSDKGYRVYVDSLMPQVSVNSNDLLELESILNHRILERENVVNQIANVLSTLTNYTTLVLGPFVAACTLRRISLLPITERVVLAVVVTDNGLTASQHIELPESVTVEDLEHIATVMNEEFAGIATNDITFERIKRVTSRVQYHINRFEHSFESLLRQLCSLDRNKVFKGGASNILTQPEFSDLTRFRELVETLESEEFVYDVLSEGFGEELFIRIGRENQHDQIKDCSIITASYGIDDKIIGTIGILGPTRMTYSRVVSLLHYVTTRLTDVLRG